MVRRVVLSALTLLLALLAGAPAAAAEEKPAFTVLMLTPDLPDDIVSERAEQATAILGRTYGVRFDVSHDTALTPERLAGYQAVLLAGVTSFSGDALGAWTRAGHGLVIAGAGSVNAQPAETWYEELVGTRVSTKDQSAEKRDVTVYPSHPATGKSPSSFDVIDTWWTPSTDPVDLPGFTQLATYPGPGGKPTTSAWGHELDSGRVFVTSMGNDWEAWGEGDFLKLLRGGLWWASGTSEPQLQRTDQAAPAWPYVVAFVLWIGAIVVGGVIAVTRTGRPVPAA
ncbi:hypothetical protein Afil01_42950 [Actinorhabdospora filicis]|uniref:ThuA-like domain-containing protein n=1 Tax=Actinorhabdospora filicis TaxID=1785913 RepID=A0A9W6SNJ0_9ACTN|nr:ThuA domain-containing protein [Actinorhabdospora filicis]GLZ79488.1 hypothetical protein Afil01_42950 [Actinorhabdospora filicis]